MVSKKEVIRNHVQNSKKEIFTVNSLYFEITGRSMGAIWHTPVIECSRSTIRRSLDSLEKDGVVKSYYQFGHCFDELKFKKIGETLS